nr:hypothetical protein [Tanacetum cinerariifolium]
MTDYSLWEVILNGNSPTPTRIVDGTVQPIAPTTAKKKLAKKNVLKAIRTLLMALPDNHQLKFNIHKDVKSLMEAIEKSIVFDCDELNSFESDVSVPTSLGYDRPSALIIEDWVSDSEDESKGEHMPTQKAPSFGQTSEHVKTPRTSVKPVEHPTPAKNLRKYILKSRGHRHSWHRKACFVCKSVNHLIKDCDYYEKNMVQNPVWNHAMRVNHHNSTRMTYPHSKKHVVPTTVLTSFESDVSVPTSPGYDRYKSGEGYHAVLPPYIGTFMPSKPNLVFHDASTVSETFPTVINVEPSPTKTTKDMSQSNRPSALIIEDWVSDSEDESKGEHMPTQKAPSFGQTSEHVKTPRTSVKPVEHPTPAKNLRKYILKSRGHRHSWHRKACFVCKSVNHLIKDCDYYEKNMVQNPVWNHAMRVNHHNSTRMTYPHSKKHVVPTTVLTRSRLVPFNAARPVTTAIPLTNVKP